MRPADSNDKPAPNHRQSETSVLKGLFLIGISVLVLYSIYKLMGPPRTPVPTVKTDAEYRRAASMACERQIRSVLHDPDSAQFPDRDSFAIRTVTLHRDFEVEVQLRARNAFNALRLVRYRCTIRDLEFPPEGGFKWTGSALQLS